MSSPQYGAASVYGPIHFAVATQSNGTVMTSDTHINFPPRDDIQLDFVHGESSPALVPENTKQKVGYDMA
jgi:hypothetical protein